MSGRSGGSPMPPATMTTSRPKASSIGQPRPTGPRSPICEPGGSEVMASVLAPSSRMVRKTSPSR